MSVNETLRKQIAAELERQHIRIVVLDDDPTGIQTVHGCLLLTVWTEPALREAFSHAMPFFYLLTNTRAMTRRDAERVTAEAMNAVLSVWKAMGKSFRLIFISRSDSTLRGHYPLETDVMRRVLSGQGIPVCPLDFLIPAFLEAGRLTIGGVHYLKEGEQLIPVAETEFARDNVFAYRHSDLKGYIEEKTGISPIAYCSMSVGDRVFPPVREGLHVTADAVEYEDLQRFVVLLLKQMENCEGAVVIRSSSSLPKALSGIEDKGILSRGGFLGEKAGGSLPVFIVGSHVKKTTAQLEQLLQCPGTAPVEVNVQAVLEGMEVSSVEKDIADAAAEGRVPVVFTSRTEIRLSDADARQRLGQTVSAFLVETVRRLPFRPLCLIAKGGITSHDILTRGLEVKTATVMGQILPGVPCLRTSAEARIPYLPYVIFPGNVGSESALADIYRKLDIRL